MASAGAPLQNAEPWKPDAVVDRRVITAEQTFSATAFAGAFLAKLAGEKATQASG